MTEGGIARLIDCVLPWQEATASQVEQLCEEAMENRFCSVCVDPIWVKICADRLRGTGVRVCGIAGFPLGTEEQRKRTRRMAVMVAEGADEVAVGINLGAIRERRYSTAQEELKEARMAAANRTLTVTLECGTMTLVEKATACAVAQEVGAEFVENTGVYGCRQATIEDVRFLRSLVSPSVGVKAAGGINNHRTALAMIEAGATRLGSSNGVSILRGEGALHGCVTNR